MTKKRKMRLFTVSSTFGNFKCHYSGIFCGTCVKCSLQQKSCQKDELERETAGGGGKKINLNRSLLKKWQATNRIEMGTCVLN